MHPWALREAVAEVLALGPQAVQALLVEELKVICPFLTTTYAGV